MCTCVKSSLRYAFISIRSLSKIRNCIHWRYYHSKSSSRYAIVSIESLSKIRNCIHWRCFTSLKICTTVLINTYSRYAFVSIEYYIIQCVLLVFTMQYLIIKIIKFTYVHVLSYVFLTLFLMKL